MSRAPGSRALYATCFAAGAFVMALEMLGFRLLAPWFGYSHYVWGSLIGVIMTCLSLGYVVGGAVADRWPDVRVLYAAVVAAGAYVTGLAFIYRPLLAATQGLGLVGGSMAATGLLFALPMLLLSAVSPFMVRVLVVQGRVGITAGGVWSVSTAGSIAGTFLSSFAMIPQLGSHLTLVACASGLLLLGSAGLALCSPRLAPALALPLVPLLAASPPPPRATCC